MPAAIADRLHGDETAYAQQTVDAPHAHGAKVAFVSILYWSGPAAIGEHGFFANQDAMYQGWAQLNRKGAEVMTDWLSGRIAPFLGEAPKQ